MKDSGENYGFFSSMLLMLETSVPFMAIRRGVMSAIPLVMTGAIALALRFLPIDAYQHCIKHSFGGVFEKIFILMQNGTQDVIALVLVPAIAHAYGSVKNETLEEKLSPAIVSLTALSCFVLFQFVGSNEPLITLMGNTRVAAAIATALISSALFVWIWERKPLGVSAYSADSFSFHTGSLTSLFPSISTIAIFAVAAVLHREMPILFRPDGWAAAMYSDLIAKGPTLGSAIIFMFLAQLMWCFGIHGPNVLEAVAQDLFVPAVQINQGLLASGLAPTEIFSKTFLDAFALMGGSGSTLCLMAAILLFGKSRSQRRLMKLSSIPSLLNMNELILFGVPIVFNPIYFIPFTLVPVLFILTSYFAVANGLVPITVNHVEWTTPIFISGYVATGSIWGSLLQAFNLILGTLCYLPFFLLGGSSQEKKNSRVLEKAYAIIKENPAYLSLREDSETVSFLRFLALDLENALAQDKLQMYYQPQVDEEGRVLGVEALLRWKHESYGFIAPQLVIRLAESVGMIRKLGYWIIEKVCIDIVRMKEAGRDDIVFSVNVSPVQLEDRYFAQTLLTLLEMHSVKPSSLIIEITEESALSNSPILIEQLETLVKRGIKLAMDDFGMGHTSLKYMRDYPFDTVKIDGSIVREIVREKKNADIISAIVSLGRTMSFTVVAEYVEDKEQFEALRALGCVQYQGYLFGKPVPFEDTLDVVLGKGS